MRYLYSVFVFERSRCKKVSCNFNLCYVDANANTQIYKSHYMAVGVCVTIYPSSALSGSPVCQCHFFYPYFSNNVSPLTHSQFLCLSPLLQLFLQSHLCVSPACFFTFTPDSRHLGIVMPKHSQGRPENESLFPSISPRPVSL